MKKVEKKYSLKLIRDIGKLSSDGVCIFNLHEKNFVYFNKPFVRILKTSKEKLTILSYQLVQSLIKDNLDYVNHQLTELLNKGSIQNVEFRLKFKSTENYVTVDAFMLNSAKLLLVMVKDTTISKIHANYIVEFGARKDALLDMVAHNLSGPLNLTNDLLNVIDQLSKTEHYKKIEKYSRLIRESTQQCIEIINSFLDEEHTESERVVVKHNLFDVNAKVQIVVGRLKLFNNDKQWKVVSNCKELMVSGDDVKFFQVVHNLLSNAVKFTPPKGTITVQVNQFEHFFEVTISDTGIGIPEHFQPYIFQRNTPASREGLKGEKSIGMGLYIVKKLTDMMHGQVSFESEENLGTTFVVRLPKE